MPSAGRDCVSSLAARVPMRRLRACGRRSERPSRAPLDLPRRRRLQLVADRAVAGVRVELGAEVRRQVERRRRRRRSSSPSRPSSPCPARRGDVIEPSPVCSFTTARACRSTLTLPSPVSTSSSPFGVRRRSPSRRPVASVSSPADVGRADAAVAGAQLEPPVHVLDPDRAVAAARA